MLPPSSTEASVAQSGRPSRCQRECRGFKSLRSLHFLSPQLKEAGMYGGIALLIILIIGVPLALLIWLGVKASRAAQGVSQLEVRLDALSAELRSLKREIHPAPPAPESVKPVVPAPAPPP